MAKFTKSHINIIMVGDEEIEEEYQVIEEASFKMVLSEKTSDRDLETDKDYCDDKEDVLFFNNIELEGEDDVNQSLQHFE